MRKAVLSVVGRVDSETLGLVFGILAEMKCEVVECYKRDLSSLSFMIAELNLSPTADVEKVRKALSQVEERKKCKITLQDAELYEYMHRI